MIIVDPKKPALPCVVIDLSAGGACIQYNAPDTLPKRFVLLHGKTKKSCLVMWKTRFRLGVQF